MAGYASRQATYSDGDTVLATHSNSEYNQILAAFNASTGHSHDGTAGEGANIQLIIDNDSDTKITVENSADEDTIRFFTGAGGEQFAISDGKIEPKVNNDVDIGSNSFKFKNIYIAGTSTLAGVILTGTLDLDGQKLILDADGDTSITADTDDQIDIEIAGADDFRFTANTFTALSGSTISIPAGATIDVSAGTLTLANDQISGDKISGGTIGGPVTIVSPVITTSPTAAGSTWTDLGIVTTVDINGGTIDGVTIGGATPGAVTTSSLVATTADINGGTVDGTTIGASSRSTALFTTLGANGNVAFDGGTFVFNDSGAALDARFEGDTDANLLFLDASADFVGIGTSTPEAKLHIYKGDSGATPFSAADLIIEEVSGSNAWLVFATANTNSGGIAWADPENTQPGSFSYDHATNSFTFRVAGVDTTTISSAGRISTTNATNGETGISSAMSSTGSSGNTRSYYGSNAGSAGHGILMQMTHASYAGIGGVLYGTATRAANSAYDLLGLYSGDGGDAEFRLRGDGNGYADGSWNGSGADYAEFFEAADGLEIPKGTPVVLDGNKVRAATELDDPDEIIGVVRPKEDGKNSMVIGNTAWNHWSNKYLTDEWGTYIREDVQVASWNAVDESGVEAHAHSYYISGSNITLPEGITVPEHAVIETQSIRKLNPDYSPNATYTSRYDRPEWPIIGLVGQVQILKGQPVNPRWVKMRDLTATVEEWFIR